jgi:UDP-glucose 4-epimerase
MPYITQTAAGIRDHLNVWGDDYPTPDGTAIRDYIHVMDLAEAHVAALEGLTQLPEDSLNIYNAGTGQGYSVLEVIHAFEKSTGISLPYKVAPRRAGDVISIYADPGKIQKELGWKARYSIQDMTRSAWIWEKHFREELKWDE